MNNATDILLTISIATSLMFIYSTLLNLITDKGFNKKNIISLSYKSILKTIFMILRTIQTRNTKDVSVRMFMSSIGCLLLSFISLTTIKITTENNFLFTVLIYLIGSLVYYIVQRETVRTISNDSKVASWMINSLLMISLLACSQLNISNFVLSQLVVLILILITSRLIFNDSENLAIINNNTHSRIVSSTWITASTFMIVRFLISKQSTYLFSIEFTTYLITILLILFNIFLMRQTTSEIKSSYNTISKKPESIGVILLVIFGVIDWAI